MQVDLETVRAVFRAEATEQLSSLEQDLLEAESSASPATLERIFRSIHTLKGNARLMGFPAASELAHAFEDVIEKLSAHRAAIPPALGTLLLQAVDGLRELINLVPTQEGRGKVDAAELQRHLKQAAQEIGSSARAPEPVQEPHEKERAAEASARTPLEQSLRVGLPQLDKLLDLTGEIAIARGRLSTMLEQTGRYTPEQLLAAHQDADRLYLDLQELVLKMRMVPIGRAFKPFSRTLRDLSDATGKLVRLEVSGEEVEVDTTVVDLIQDPLTHLVRNAVDHGIELPDVRRQRGKESYGTVRLRAFHEAGSVIVEVEDDGAGLDRERIRDRARALGLLGPGEERGDAELFQLIFMAGFTTAERVTELSGRGIGMDVVKRNLESLHGSISIDTQPERGTTFSMRLPLMLSIIEGFSVGVGEETYILPLQRVIECVELPEQERRPGLTGVLDLRGQPLPFLRLRDHFELPGLPPARESIVVVGHGRGQAGLAVDTLVGQGQTVVKPLGGLFQNVSGISGTAILGTGRVALILDVPALLEKALQ